VGVVDRWRGYRDGGEHDSKRAFHFQVPFVRALTTSSGTASRSDADAAVWIAQGCSVAVVAKPALACQSSAFFRHLSEAITLARG
jgi:hypothetical protein